MTTDVLVLTVDVAANESKRTVATCRPLVCGLVWQMHTSRSYASKPVIESVCPVSVALVLVVEMVPSDLVAILVNPLPPPPPDAVPVVMVPSDARKILPCATSDAVAVVTVASSNLAVPPPVLGSVTAGTAL